MHNNKQVFSGAGLGMLLFGVVLISIGSILPTVMDQFDLNESEAGFLASLLPSGILIGSIGFGPIADRYGYKKILVISAALILMGLEGMALANNTVLLEIAVLVIGIGGGIINGGTNAVVADISTGEKSSNLSLLGVFFGIGALGMPVIMGMLNNVWTYQKILIFVGGLVLIPIAYFLLIRFPAPKQKTGFPIKDGLRLIRDPLIILLGFILFCQSSLEGLTNNWTTTYLAEAKNFSSDGALFTLSLYVLGMTVMRLFLGFMLNKMRPYIVLTGSIVCCVASTLLIHYSNGEFVSIIGLILLGMGFAAGFPVILGYVGDLYHQLSGTAFSFVLSIALIGNISSNYTMGIVAQRYGIQQLPITLITALAIMTLLLFITFKKLSKTIKI